MPFLGEGYYYWDNNINTAHFWGKSRYRNQYFILESELNLETDFFFDLVGNRQHMLDYITLYNKVKEKFKLKTDWPIGRVFEFLKILEKQKEYKGIFPFKVIRAIDNSVQRDKQFDFYFVSHRNNYTNLAPRLVICVIQKNNVILRSEIHEQLVA